MLDRERNPLENEVLGGPIASGTDKTHSLNELFHFDTPRAKKETTNSKTDKKGATKSKKGVNISLFYLLSRELEVDITDVESLPKGVSPPWDS